MRSLKQILSRVNAVAERAQVRAGKVDIVAILQQGRRNARLGIRPEPMSDDELRRSGADPRLIERLIRGRRRYQEYCRQHGLGGEA